MFEKYKEFAKPARELNSGVQHRFRFPNNYGASVIKGPYSYGGPQGLWELAVKKFDGDDWELCYDTVITNDVIGHNTEAEIEALLERIKAL